MKAAITTENGEFEVVTLPDPSPKPDEVVLRVGACGVCGSDIKARPFMPPGTVMGHEIGGEVVATGSDASAFGYQKGKIVAILPVVSCGVCTWCSRGDVAHCSSVRFIGMGSDAGGFAEFAVVPARHVFSIPEGLPVTYAALVEPFAVGLHSAAAAEIGPGDHVLIVGAGGVGLTTLAWAHARGAERVTVADPAPARRAMAQAMGATDVLRSVADADDESYDALVECVGRPELVEACVAPSACSWPDRDRGSMRAADQRRADQRTAERARFPVLARLQAERLQDGDRRVLDRCHRPGSRRRPNSRPRSCRLRVRDGSKRSGRGSGARGAESRVITSSPPGSRRSCTAPSKSSETGGIWIGPSVGLGFAHVVRPS